MKRAITGHQSDVKLWARIQRIDAEHLGPSTARFKGVYTVRECVAMPRSWALYLGECETYYCSFGSRAAAIRRGEQIMAVAQ